MPFLPTPGGGRGRRGQQWQREEVAVVGRAERGGQENITTTVITLITVIIKVTIKITITLAIVVVVITMVRPLLL
jgi:hypothetical protein